MMNRRPPKWPFRILRFFVKKEYAEEIEGDMEELFHDTMERTSYRRAQWIFIWEVIKLFRPVLIKNMEAFRYLSQIAMFKNYLTVSFRGLLKNPTSSFINVTGLAAAIGICTFAYTFARWTYSTDQFHENKDKVFMVTSFADRDGGQYGKTPRPIGEMMKHDLAHVRQICRIEDRNVVVKVSDNLFHERIRCTDASFLDLFTFPLKWGMPESLADLNSVILSEEMAIKYFGDMNPVGQTILVITGSNQSKAFKIGGVAKAFPESRSFEFEFLINYENIKTMDPGYDMHDWTKQVDATFVELDQPGNARPIEQAMEKYRQIQNEAVAADWAVRSFKLEPLLTLHRRTGSIRDDISRSSDDNYATIKYLVFVCVLMLALGCLNYINIAIVSAAKRLKEIGVRKSIGASRSTVIVQFLSENLVITAFALVVGVLLGYAVFIRGFEHLWDFKMDFRLWDPSLWIFLLGVLVLTSLASGIYPSLYISRFQVSGILKGSIKFGQRNPVTKAFLGIQLVLACIFITSAVLFTRNSDFLARRSWGYNQQEAIYAVIPDSVGYEKLSALMAQDPNVLEISGSEQHVGKSHSTAILHFPDREVEVDRLSVDPNYFRTLGLKLESGRTFNNYEGADKQSVVVNDQLVRTMAWKDPVGQHFMIDSLTYEVIGVTSEFHSYSFSRKVHPIIFTVADKGSYRYLTMKARTGSKYECLKALQSNWRVLFPEVPFEGGYQEDVWGGYFGAIEIHGLVWRVLAIIAVVLASLGLYGLITLNVAGRTREFSIRRVLGARAADIAGNISRPYLALFGVALAIGAPLSYVLVKIVIESAYAYHMVVDFSGSVVAVGLLILVLLLTVSTQIGKVVKANPSDGLKIE